MPGIFTQSPANRRHYGVAVFVGIGCRDHFCIR